MHSLLDERCEALADGLAARDGLLRWVEISHQDESIANLLQYGVNMMKKRRVVLLLGLPVSVALWSGCPTTAPETDAASFVDAALAQEDAAIALDARRTPDAFTRPDAGPPPDAFVGPDVRTYGDAPFTPGECLPVTPVGTGLMLTGQNSDVSMTRDFSDIGCGGNRGPAVYYSVEVGPRQRLEATLSSEGLFDNLVFIDTCEDRYCRDVARMGETLRYTNPSSTTQSFLLAASRLRASEEAPYDLAARVIDVDAGQACTLPIAVTSGARLRGQNVRFGGDLPGFGCGYSFDAAAFYSITVPAGQRLTVRTRAARPMQVRVSNGCDFADLRCLAFGGNSTATYTNSTASEQPVVISVTPDLGNIYALAFELDVDLAP